MLQKRRDNWWEPVYDGRDIPLRDGDWEFEDDTPKAGVTLKNPEQTIVKIVGKTFNNCDFTGAINNVLRFVGCKFTNCDFGGSKWELVRFSKCEFKDSSFTMSEFSDCEFRDCKFNRINYSGNTTKIEKTLITNPSSFVDAITVFARYLPNHVSIAFQKANLLRTRSTMARIILANVTHEGSEETYYEAVKVCAIAEARSRHVHAQLNVYGEMTKFDWSLILKSKTNSIMFPLLYVAGKFDEIILTAIGFVNSWGRSLFRTISFGVVIIFIFSLLYNINDGLKLNIINVTKSVEIFFLFGYTSYLEDVTNVGIDRFFMLCNAIAGLIWYAIAIPTFVNRVTRVRG